MMSHDDDWEGTRPRRRGDRWAEDDSEPDYRPFHPRNSGRSGVVTALGVVTLLLGILVLLAGLCVGAGIMLAAADEMHGGPGADQGGLVFGLLICLIISLWGGSALASGIGLIGRRAWARVLTLIVAGFAAVGGLIFLFFSVAAWFTPNMAMDGPERGFLILGSLILLFGGLIFLGYCLWAYLVLPRSVYGQEFR
jgi:hypothetical protein